MDLDTVLSAVLVLIVLVFVIQHLVDVRASRPEPPKQKQYGEITLETLELYGGYDPFRPILLSIKGRVYNVSEGGQFYGRGGSYAKMAGRECARALAKMRLEDEDFTDNISDCSDAELKTLHDWIMKLNNKYPVVGKVGDSDCSVFYGECPTATNYVWVAYLVGMTGTTVAKVHFRIDYTLLIG